MPVTSILGTEREGIMKHGLSPICPPIAQVFVDDRIGGMS